MGLLLPDIIEAIDVERIDSGQRPHDRTIESALREAMMMGWRARHVFSLLRQEQANGR